MRLSALAAALALACLVLVVPWPLVVDLEEPATAPDPADSVPTTADPAAITDGAGDRLWFMACLFDPRGQVVGYEVRWLSRGDMRWLTPLRPGQWEAWQALQVLDSDLLHGTAPRPIILPLPAAAWAPTL